MLAVTITITGRALIIEPARHTAKIKQNQRREMRQNGGTGRDVNQHRRLDTLLLASACDAAGVIDLLVCARYFAASASSHLPGFDAAECASALISPRQSPGMRQGRDTLSLQLSR